MLLGDRRQALTYPRLQNIDRDSSVLDVRRSFFAVIEPKVDSRAVILYNEAVGMNIKHVMIFMS